ncbi:MAG: 4-hydroxy-3-methylbut-2-enyl diphosphate reductase [Candidatus Margulisiibacteriota bacterium]
MKIVRAQCCGFCTGVAFAYEKAVETAKKGKKAYILGYLVHNSDVIKKLEEMGVNSIKDLSEIPAGEIPVGVGLIISAHGVGPKTYEDAKKMGLEIVDTTCPWVKKAQQIAKMLYEDGSQVVIVGDRDHTEVKGIKGWTQESAIVVEGPKDVETLPFCEKMGIVAQTTQSVGNFEATVAALKEKSGTVRVENTICSATEKRQEAAIELARQADLMIVIGDVRSANTNRLRELCLGQGVETHMIHSADEIKTGWLENKKTVGITAGASTPEWVIKEIVDRLEG